jgi:uncharacterized protein YgiM (DUF1202 family)
VTGVAANDTLNVRAGPSTGHDIKGELANGDVVRNLGCRMMGQSRWCHVKTLGEQSIEGWAAGRYLAEAARPEMATGEGRTLSSSDDPSKPDLYQRPSGEIEVNFKSGCGALYDADGTTITSGYSCTAEQLRAAEQAIAQSRK